MKTYRFTWINHFHWQEIVVGLVFLGATLVYFFPLLKSPTTALPDPTDGGLISYILYRVDENLLSGRDLLDGGFFHPYEKTLAYSDLFLTDAILTLPIYLLTREPVAQFITALLISQVLLLMMTYFLLHEVTDDRLVALGLALVFGFSTLRLHYVGHLQMMSIYWVPLFGLSLIKLGKRASKGWLIMAAAAFVFQVWNSFLPGMFMVLVGGLFLRLDQKLRQNLFLLRWWLAGVVVLVGIMLGPIVWSYFDTFSGFDYVRPINDAMHFSLSLEELWGKFLSPGLWVLLLLGLIIEFKAMKRTVISKVLWLITGLSLIMALGPALKWMEGSVKFPLPIIEEPVHIPLPYAVAYYLIPGFKAFRTPSRWLVLAGLMGVVAAGMALMKLSRKSRLLVLGGVMILSLIYLPNYRVYQVPEKANYPAVYYWLEQQAGEVVAELPMATWGQGEATQKEVERMLYSTLHGKRLVNGYSGFTPPEWEKMVIEVNRLPLKEALRQLREFAEVDLVVVEKQRMPIELSEGAEVCFENNKSWVYKVSGNNNCK